MVDRRFWRGDRVSDKAGNRSGVVTDYAESKIGYTLVVDWCDGWTSREHEDDLIPDVGAE